MVELSSQSILRDGEPYAVLGVARDITERRALEAAARAAQAQVTERESRLELLFSQAMDPILVVDPSDELRILDYNEEAKHFFEVPGEDLIGTLYVELLVSGYEVWPSIQDQWAPIGELVNRVRQVRRRDGSVATVEVRAKQMREDFSIIAMRDITARTEAMEQRQHAQSLAGISHEFRTPLNSLLGFAQLLETDETLTAEQSSQVRNIREAGERLTRLTDTALEAPRLGSGGWSLDPKRVHPGEVIRRITQQFLPIAEANETQFSVDLDNVRDVGDWDENLLRVVVDNLVSNALKYTVKGSVAVSAECDEKRLLIEIRDTGVGIPAGEHEKIFEEFYRGSVAEDSRFHGSGLGLAVVRQLVHLHQGNVFVKSRPGRGSTFSIELPVVRAG